MNTETGGSARARSCVKGYFAASIESPRILRPSWLPLDEPCRWWHGESTGPITPAPGSRLRTFSKRIDDTPRPREHHAVLHVFGPKRVA
jgi:hypothetical protein